MKHLAVCAATAIALSLPATGVQALLGTEGRARTTLAADTPGQIDLHGEIWRAVSRTSLQAGDTVRVTDVNGLTLLVEPARAAMSEGDTRWKG